jgi:hypothetical protein
MYRFVYLNKEKQKTFLLMPYKFIRTYNGMANFLRNLTRQKLCINIEVRDIKKFNLTGEII